MFKPSKELIDFIKKKEGLRTKPYKDFDGRPAVGYGDTANVTGPISEQEAEARLIKRLEEGGQRLASTVKRKDLKQSQIDAMLDMEYNIGLGNLREQGFIDLVNTGTDQDIVTSMGKFTKARDTKGVFKELPGLVERSRARQEMWGSVVSDNVSSQAAAPQGASNIFTGASSNDLDLASAVASIGNVETEGFSLEEAVRNVGNRKQPEVDQKLGGLRLAGDLNEDPAYVDARQKAQEFARQERIPFDQAEALIFERDPKLVKIKMQEQDFVKYFPQLADWASDPINYKKLKENPEAYKKLASAASRANVSVLDDISRVAKDNVWQLEKSYYFTGAVLGIIPVDEAQNRNTAIEIERAKNPYGYYAQDIAEINTAWENLKNIAQTKGPEVETALSDLFSGNGNVVDNLRKIYKAGVITTDQAIEVAKTIADNPGAFAIQGAQSVNSLAASQLGRIIGGAGGAVLGPKGALAGAFMGAATSSFLLEFGGALESEMNEFRDPDTGIVDLRKALSDSKRVARWKALAASKAGTTASIDALFALRLGKAVSAPATASTRAGRVLQKTGQAIKGGTIEAVGEGVSELAGQTQRRNVNQFYGTPFTSKDFYGDVVTSTQEGVTSIGTSVGGEVAVGAGSRIRQKTSETLARYRQARKAEDAYEQTQAIRDTIEENPDLKNNPEDLAAIINAPVQEGATPESNADDIDLEAETSTELSNILNSASDVTVMVREFDRYFEAQGIDPLTIINAMPAEVSLSYNEAKRADGSFTVSKGDWIVNTLDYKNIDAIVLFKGLDVTPLEGTQFTQQFQEDPFQTLAEIGEEPPPIPGEELPPVIEGQDNTTGNDADFIKVVPDENSDLILRPVELTSKMRSSTEQDLFKKFVAQVKASTKDSPNIAPEAAEIIADLEFEHMKYRARQLGKTVEELLRMLSVGQTRKAGAKGIFSRRTSFGMPYKVAFNRSADAKTMIHELGHSWLHEMSEDFIFLNQIPEANRTEEQKELLNLMDMVAQEYRNRGFKMENIADIYNRPDEEVTAIHEIFSQTTEMWAFDNKFENNRMRYIMEKFFSWLAELAHIMGRTYPEYPPLKITPEIRRLFTVITNADEKVQENLSPMFNDQPEFPPGFLGEDEDRYMNAWRDARSESIGSFVANSMFRSFREREALIRKEQARLYQQATETVDARPAMQMLSRFEFLLSEYKAKNLDFDPRISEKSFREVMANDDLLEAERLRQSMPRSLVAKVKGGGMDIRDVMLQYGINSKEEMLELLTEMGKRQELIDAEFDKLIETEMPVFKSDEELHKEAVAALNSRGREKLVSETFDILKNRFPREFRRLIERGMMPPGAITGRDIKKFFKDKAYSEILKRGAEGFNPFRLMGESDRLGKEAASMFRRGDIEEAMDLKYKQALLYYQAREGFAVAKSLARVKALRKYISKKAGNADALKNDFDAQIITYAKYIADRTEKDFNLELINPDAISQFSGVAPSQVEMINEAVKELLRVSEFRSAGTRDVATDLALEQVLDITLAVAKKAKEVEILGRAQTLSSVTDALIAEVGERQDSDPEYTKEQYDEKTVTGMWRRANMEMLTLDTIFSSLFANAQEYAKSTLSRVMQKIKEAEAVRSEVVGDLREKIYDAGKKAAIGEGKVEFIKGVLSDAVRLKGDANNPIQLKNMNITLNNKADLYGFLLQSGSESNLEALMIGGIYDKGKLGFFDPTTGQIDTRALEQDIEDLISQGILKKEDFDFMQTIFDAYESLYPEVKKVARKYEGREIGYVQPRQIRNSLGTWRGGYVPMSRTSVLPQGPADLLLDPLKSGLLSGMFPVANKSSLEGRVKSPRNVNIDIGHILNMFNQVGNLAYMYPVMSDVAKIFTAQDFVAALEARRPGVMNAVVRPWYQRTQLQRVVDPDQGALAEVAKFIRHRVPLVYYLGNVKTVGKQLLGVIQSVPAMGIGSELDVVAAIGDMAMNPARAYRSVEEIKGMSPRLRDRFKKGQRRLIQDMDDINANFTAGRTVRDMAQLATFLPIQFTQNTTDLVIFNAAMRNALRKGLSDKEALRFAENIIEKTQGGASVSGLAAAQAGSEFKKLVSAFSSVPITLKNVAYEGMRAPTKEKLKFMVHFGLYTIALTSYFESLINSIGGEDEEKKLRRAGYTKGQIDEMRYKKYALGAAAQIGDSVMPIYTRPMIELLAHGSVRTTPSLDTAFRATQRTASAGMDTKNGIELDEVQVKAIFDFLSIVTGYPLTLAKIGVNLNELSKSEGEKAVEKSIRASKKRLQREKDR